MELWSAPYTTTPAGFVAKKVKEIGPDFVIAKFGEGHFAYRANDQTLRVVRIADGQHADVVAPTGFGWAEPAGVVGGSVWMTIHAVPGVDSATYSVARVPLASLGPWAN